MTTDLAPFPNVILGVRALLADLAEKVSTEAPASPWNGSPAVLRLRITGGNDNLITDVIRLDVDALTDNGQTSDQLAEQVRQRLLAAPGRTASGLVFDTVTTDQRPHPVPWGDNTKVRNTTASYRISARR